MKHFFEKEEQRSEFLSELASGEISLKWAYSGSATPAHDQLAKSEGYSSNVDSSRLENLLLSRWPGSFIDVVDIGPGNAMHTLSLWAAVPKHERPQRILLLDFSQDLLDLCHSRLVSAEGVLEGAEISTGLWDFEISATKEISNWRTDRPVLAQMTGNTIGNPQNPISVLENITKSLRPGDLFLISVALRSDDTQVLASYQESSVFLRAASEPFRMAGLDIEGSDLRMTIDDEGAVVAHLTLTEENVRRLEGYAPKSNVVRCFRSRRFTVESARELLEKAGLQVLDTEVSEREHHLTILSTPGSLV